MGSCGSGETCYMQENGFVWLNTYLQMRNLTDAERRDYSMSQFYDKVAEGKCMPVSTTVNTMMNTGRKCTYAFTCATRSCDATTKTCDGRKVGESCSGHAECDSDLACRVETVWPYGTTCQPRGEVKSVCDTDYDCKMRNFCWQTDASSQRICLE
jgi:hypothetical protein